MATGKAKSKSAETDSRQPSPAPVTTIISWAGVTGARLEELLYGFLDEMGAQDLIWRAGSASGVTAADSGRDIEAVFSSLTPDGSVELVRWWVEAKGRSSTVKKGDVVDSVVATLAKPEVDVFVFCTNSRFSNPTRDWVTDWQKAHPRPKVRLWDRDDLGRFVRRYPLVAARTVPESLDVADRLALLIERYEGLGEPPTNADLEFFWSHIEALTELKVADLISAVAMFAYAETDHGLVERPWASLLPTDPMCDMHLAVYAVAILPTLVMRERARPIDSYRLTQTGAYLLLSAMGTIDPDTLHKVMANPHDFLVDMDVIARSPKAVQAFSDAIVLPIWNRVQQELMDVCGDDCRRMMSDPGAAFPQPLVGERYWRRFGIGEPLADARLIMESCEAPCTVGLPLTENHMCPLGRDPEISLERVTEMVEIVRYRRSNPKNHAY